jgi:hypothetical protein
MNIEITLMDSKGKTKMFGELNFMNSVIPRLKKEKTISGELYGEDIQGRNVFKMNLYGVNQQKAFAIITDMGYTIVNSKEVWD